MPNLKKHYLVVACTSCGRFLLAASDKRTRTCAYCGKRVKIEDARVIARSEDAREARLVLRDAKAQEQRGRSGNSSELR